MKKKCQTFAEAIQRLLDQTGLNSRQLSLKANLSAATVHRVIAADQLPRSDVLQKILQAAGVGWAWLDANLAPAALEEPPEPKKLGRPKKEEAGRG